MIRYLILSGLATTLLFGCFETPYVQGERIYKIHCQNCHMDDGSGLETLIKPLNNSSLLGSDKMICIIITGIQDTIHGENDFLPKEMPAFKQLTPVELTNLINFINSKWDTNFKEKSIKEIQNSLEKCNF